MITDYTNIFNESQCLTNDEMLKYISGQLSKEDKQRVERHVADCEMCNDELEGMILMKDRKKLNEIITILNTKIIHSANSVPYKVKSSQKFTIIRITAIAASAVLIVFASIYLYFVSIHKSDHLAEMNKASEVNNGNVSKISPEMKLDSINSLGLNENYKNDDRTGTGEDISIESVAETENESYVKREIVDDEVTSDMTVTAGDEINSNNNERGDVEGEKEELDKISPSYTVVSEDLNDTDTGKEKANKKDNKMIGYNSRSVPSENIIAGRNSDDKLKSYKASALFSYEGKVYNEALEGFTYYLEQNPNDIEVIYKAGMCHYFLKNYSKAITQFNSVLTKGSGMYFDDAEWYKTQSLIKQNNTDAAKQMLKLIASKNGKYKKDAQKLLSDLDQ
jgi:tetratricopeptide (TPR) repeat protein